MNTKRITSVGIDIGTTTTQLVISRLTIRNSSPGSMIPRMIIDEKEVIYRSNIHFTPIQQHQLIDRDAIYQIMQREYQLAGISPADVETGAVIITGETAKKENARNILEVMADFAGDFVVATAGVNLEAILAGKGSGAASYSKERNKVVANIDVGGGTANIGVFQRGRAIDTACVNIGGHLIELAKGSDQLTFIAEPARLVLAEAGLPLTVGTRVTLEQLKKVAMVMAQVIYETITTKGFSPLAEQLLMSSKLKLDYIVDEIMISGGVANYVYNDYQPVAISDVTKYGDMGPLLGWAIRELFKAKGLKLTKPSETIRATVIGAGIHSLEISGSTIHVNEGTLPLRNLPVVAPFFDGVPADSSEIAKTLRAIIDRIRAEDPEETVALAIKEPNSMSYLAIQELSKGIVEGMAGFLQQKKPLVLVVEADCGKVLGQTLEIISEKKLELVCIDQIEVHDGDYVDIGKPVMGGRVVPVVVKTLAFENANKN
ncbi:MAG: ethanolamine ammonia-lyase reactivating factor EutA [Bacillota bacterium]|nr:ethanolamine ammonia-lyase reactivating factor EutA [Bacillota bacterium]